MPEQLSLGFPHSSVSKESACNAGDLGLIPGLGRSLGEGNGNPLQYSCLENPMDGGAWRASLWGPKSWTRLKWLNYYCCLMKVKEESEKTGLKLNIQKIKIMAFIPHTHGQQMGKRWKQWQTSFPWAPKSLQMVTVAMKLKDTCSLEEKLWQT